MAICPDWRKQLTATVIGAALAGVDPPTPVAYTSLMATTRVGDGSIRASPEAVVPGQVGLLDTLDGDETRDGSAGGFVSGVASFADGASLAPGETVLPSRMGRYVILRPIGAGGMGQVVAAQAPDGSIVALKVIRGQNPERLYRFKREFRALSAVDHPNLVALYDLVHVEDTPGDASGGVVFFTMELLAGQHVVSWVRGGAARGRALDADGLRRLEHALVGLTSGLAAVHAHGLVHRDVKPSNVMVTDVGRVAILDLGLVHEASVGALERTGHVSLLGTPLYMAPEQIVRPDDVGAPADLYSVGEIAWECLTGLPRLSDCAIGELITRKLHDAPLPPSSVLASVPPHLDELCHRLLAREPADRPGAAEILTGLGHADVSTIDVDRGALLGRDTEVAMVLAAVRATLTGLPQVLLLSGTSGFGKSALIDVVTRRAGRELQALCLLGRCSERESIPFKALDSAIDALAMVLRDDSTDIVALSSEAALLDLAALARLFPVLRTVPYVRAIDDRGLVGCDPVELRRRAGEALARLLNALARRRPVILALDDLQWMDLDSVQLLESVLQRPEPPRVTLLASFREGADQSAAPLTRLVGRLQGAETLVLQRVSIGPLPEPQALVLASQLLGVLPDEPIAARIAREAQGSPFFIAELARHARARGGLTEHVSALTLDGVVRLRLQALPESARRLVAVLALAGGQLPRSVALDVASSALASADRATLARLRAEHLVRFAGTAQDSSDGVIETYHDRIREVASRDAAEALGDGVSQTHLAIAEALLATGTADESALALHFRKGGDATRATHHTLAAAELAVGQLAFDRAAELFQTAIALETLDLPATTALRARRAEALANAGHLHAGAVAYAEAARGPEGAATEAERTEWLRLAATHFLATGHGDEGRAVLDEVLQRVGFRLTRGMPRTVAALLGQRLLLAFRPLALPRPRTQALDPRDAARMDVCWTATRGLVFVDGLTSAVFHARHLRLALASGDPVRAAAAIGFEAFVKVVMKGVRGLAEFERIVSRLEASPEVQASPYAMGMMSQFRGTAHFHDGRFEDAITSFGRAIDILRSQCVGQLHEVGPIVAHRATMLLYAGLPGDIRATSYAILRECAERPNPYEEGYARGLLGNLGLLSLDRVEEAAEQMALYERDAPRRFEVHYFNCATQQSALLRYRGDGLAAWQRHLQDEPVIRKLMFFRTPMVLTEFHRSRAENALAWAAQAKDPRPALAQVGPAARRCLAQPLPMGKGFGHTFLASAAALEGRTDAAVSHLRQAVAVYEALAMRSMLAAARRRLAALVGGDEGRELVAAADAWSTAEEIVRSDRLTEMVAPGFVRQH